MYNDYHCILFSGVKKIYRDLKDVLFQYFVIKYK